VISLTPKQRECWEYLLGYKAQFGLVPSYRKIAVALGLASNSRVHRLLHDLEARGYVRLTPRKVRSLELLAINNCPHCGHPLGSSYCREAALNSARPAFLPRNPAEQAAA